MERGSSREQPKYIPKGRGKKAKSPLNQLGAYTVNKLLVERYIKTYTTLVDRHREVCFDNFLLKRINERYKELLLLFV